MKRLIAGLLLLCSIPLFAAQAPIWRQIFTTNTDPYIWSSDGSVTVVSNANTGVWDLTVSVSSPTNGVTAGQATNIAAAVIASSNFFAYIYGIGTNATNFAYSIGANDTNFALSIGGAATNWALSIGANGTNYANSIGLNASNYALTIGGYGTNYANTIGANGTNYALSIGGNGSNYAATVSQNASNAANAYALALGANGSNYAATVSQNASNAANALMYSVAQNTTNYGSNAAWTAGSNGSNYSGTVSANASNAANALTYSVALNLTNYSSNAAWTAGSGASNYAGTVAANASNSAVAYAGTAAANASNSAVAYAGTAAANASNSAVAFATTASQNASNAANAFVSNNFLNLTGGTVSGPVLSTSASASNAPAANEFPSAGWVRSLFTGGLTLYNVTNRHPVNPDWYQAAASTNTTQQARFYTNYSVGQYLSNGIMSTQLFTQISSPMTVDSYLSLSGPAAAATVHPEFYYSYDGTNLLGDFSCGAQTLVSGTTNLYTFVVSFPTVTSTNAAGFYVVRRFKVDTISGAATIIGIHGSGGTPSKITIEGPNSGLGNAYLPNNQTFTGVNTFTQPIIGSGASLTNIHDTTDSALATASTQTIDLTADRTVSITNAVAGNVTILLTNLVDRRFFVLRCVADGSARTVSFLAPATMNWISTNGTSSGTNIAVTASKIATAIGRVWISGATTNVDLFCNIQP